MIGVFCANLLLGLPSGINYQGRLTNPSGVALSGNKSFSIALYTAATGGQAIYSENIGSVSLDANGVYSFQFGVNGTSVSGVSLPLGVTATGQAVYSKVLSEPAVTGSVSVTDGIYSWSQASGSNSPSNFLGSYDVSSRTVTAIYLRQTIPVGRNITVDYSRSSVGLYNALNIDQSQWLELTIDSSAQAPREKILGVPYAFQSSNALAAQDSVGRLEKRLNDLENFQLYSSSGMPTQAGGLSVVDFRSATLPAGVTYEGVFKNSSGICVADASPKQYSFSFLGSYNNPYYAGNSGASNNVGAFILDFLIPSDVNSVRFYFVDGTESLGRLPSPVPNPKPLVKVSRIVLGTFIEYYNFPPPYTVNQIYFSKSGKVTINLPSTFGDKLKGLKLLVNHSFDPTVVVTAEVVKVDDSVNLLTIGQTFDLNGVAAKAVILNITAPLNPSLVDNALSSLSILGTN